MNNDPNSAGTFAEPKHNAFETYSFVGPRWTCAKCRHHIETWHNANEVSGLMIHQECGGRYLPSDFYHLAMGESGRPTAVPDHGMHGMHDDWLVTG